MDSLNLSAAGAEEYRGIIAADSNGNLTVNVMGNTLTCRFADPLTLSAGDPVLVTITNDGRGGHTAYVRHRLTEQPRPAQGTVKTVPASSPTITVTGTNGTDYTATFLSSYTPTVGDTVTLGWNTTTPTVLGKVGATPAPVAPPPPPPPPPPAPPSTGYNSYAATDSATWTDELGGWDEWNGGGGNVYQGNWGGYDLHGSWFYGGGPAQLAGRTITAIKFRLGARRQVGNYNQSAAVNFYAHTNTSRPSGDVNRTTGPYTVNIPAGAGPTTITLPTSFASALLSGGGISISGGGYAGFQGRQAETDSGTLTLYWSR